MLVSKTDGIPFRPTLREIELNRSAFIAGTLALATIGMRVFVQWTVHGSQSLTLGRILCLLLAGFVLAHAISAFQHSDRYKGDRSPSTVRAVWVLWIGVLVFGIILWPLALEPSQYALATLLFFGAWAAFPAAIADSIESNERLDGWVKLWRRSLVFAFLVMAVISTAVYFVAARPSVGGVDFYYYICTSRDMLQHGSEVSDNCYLYFPGVFAFWRTAMRLVGSSLAELQACYLAALLLNAVLIAVLIGRSTRRPGSRRRRP